MSVYSLKWLVLLWDTEVVEWHVCLLHIRYHTSLQHSTHIAINMLHFFCRAAEE